MTSSRKRANRVIRPSPRVSGWSSFHWAEYTDRAMRSPAVLGDYIPAARWQWRAAVVAENNGSRRECPIRLVIRAVAQLQSLSGLVVLKTRRNYDGTYIPRLSKGHRQNNYNTCRGRSGCFFNAYFLFFELHRFHNIWLDVKRIVWRMQTKILPFSSWWWVLLILSLFIGILLFYWICA